MIRSALWWANTTWRAFQVELHGQYSHAQVQRFEQYQATMSLWRVACVCLLTPVPMVLVVLSIDFLRLEPIEMGVLHSPNVWLHHWLTCLLMAVCILQQLKQHLPEFQINIVDCGLIPILASTSAVGVSLALASVIGYPLPFTILLGGVPWYLVFIMIFALRKHQTLRNSPSALRKMKRYILVSMCQLTMTMIYPVYSYFYKSVSSLQQTAFVLVLPLIKISMKNWICHTLPGTDDAKPEAIVFNVEVFHSLFVSLCMGNTTSTRTIVALMAVDVVEMWVSFHDIQHILNGLEPIAKKLMLPKEVRMDKYPSLALLANGLLDDQVGSVLPAPPPSSVFECWKRWTRKLLQLDLRVLHMSVKVLGHERIMPAPIPSTKKAGRPARRLAETESTNAARNNPRKELLSSARALLTSAECTFLVTQTEKLLFVTEFVVLVEYTEVIMPTIYNVLVWALYRLRNREFYTFLEGICTPTALFKILMNVQLYAVLEMFSLLVVTILLWKKIGLSVVHQLAFVLEDRATNIQSKLILWVLYILQNSIVQDAITRFSSSGSINRETPHHSPLSSRAQTQPQPEREGTAGLLSLGITDDVDGGGL